MPGQTGAWIPAFAGMTVGCGSDGWAPVADGCVGGSGVP